MMKIAKRPRLLKWTYFALAVLCSFGVLIFAYTWMGYAFFVMALWCAENIGRVRQYLWMTKPEPSPNVRPMARRWDDRYLQDKLHKLSEKSERKRGA